MKRSKNECFGDRLLEDFKIFRSESGGRRYIGIWRVDDMGRSAMTALRTPDEFRSFATEQADAGRFPTDLEPRRILSSEIQPDPLPNVTTADLPGPPDWVSLVGPLGNREVKIEFASDLAAGPFHLTIHTALMPILPRNANNEIVFPDNICGLRVIGPGETIWQDADGATIADGLHLSHPDFTEIPLSTAAMSGLDFTGPMGACEGANDDWQFFSPLTSNSSGGPPNRTLTFENPEAIEFLNFNIPLPEPFGSSLKPKDYFKPAIMSQLEQIAKTFLGNQENNGYCAGVVDYMVAVCGSNPDECPLAIDFGGDVIDFNGSC